MAISERLKFEATYNGYKTKKGFKGYWEMHYTIVGIRELGTEDIIVSEQVFKSKQFKGLKLEIGDKVVFTGRVENTDSGYKIKTIRNIERRG